MNQKSVVGRAAVVVVVVVFGFVAAACAPPPSGGAPPASTIDQTYQPAFNLSVLVADCHPSQAESYQVAQTFTAGRSGTLDKVSLSPIRYSGASSLSLAIRTIHASGQPGATVIGGGSYDGPSAANGTLIDMPLDVPATVVAGTKYALVVKESACTPGTDLGWALRGAQSTVDGYTGGAQWFQEYSTATGWYLLGGSTTADLSFATWVK